MRNRSNAWGLDWVHSLVDEKADDVSADDTSYHRNREGRSWKAEADTADENDGLQAFPEDGDKRQNEHGVLFTPAPEAAACGSFGDVFGFESLRKLHPPLFFELRDTEQCSAHQGDDDGRDQAKDSFPDVLGPGPVVFPQAIEGSNQTGSNGNADEQSDKGTAPDLSNVQKELKAMMTATGSGGVMLYLSHQLLMRHGIFGWIQRMLKKCQ